MPMSLWLVDMNQRAKKPGIYYGQCKELSGPRHAYMPIAIEARSRADFERWVLSQPGGTLGGDEGVTDLIDSGEELEATESAEEGALDIGELPNEDSAADRPAALELAQ